MLRRSVSLTCLPCFHLSFFGIKSNRKSMKRNLSLSNLPKHEKSRKGLSCNKGSVSDILQIVGPLENLFSTPTNTFFYLGFLRKCIKSNDLITGRFIHVHLIKLGRFGHVVSNALLDMYAKIGSLTDCIQLFDEMPDRDLVSWCTLISGHVRHGFHLEAIWLFKKMQENGLKPNQFIVASVLKACSAVGVLEFGAQIHGMAVKTGIGLDDFVEICLVDMYVKCGSLLDAHKLFHEMPVKNSVSWNVVISGYSRNGFLGNVVMLCREMCQTGLVMDLVTLRIVMSAGSCLELVDFCKNILQYSIKIGLDSDSILASEFLRLLARLGDLIQMRKLFNAIEKPDATLFSTVISGYHLNNQRDEALKLAEVLIASDVNLNQGALVSVLNLCFLQKDGSQIHACILKNGYGLIISIGNALISMYIRCGNLDDAYLSFIKMPVHDIVSWTTIMAGHVWNFQFQEAQELFCDFRETEMALDQYIVATMISACTGLRDIEQGMQIHALSLKHGMESIDFLMTSLLHMYAKCGYMESAKKLFLFMQFPPSLVSVNVMLAGYCWNSQAAKALEVFGREHGMGLVPDQFSFSIVLGACADLKLVRVGEQIHSHIVKTGFGFCDIVVGNAIMNLYVKCGSLDDASKSFFAMKWQDANSYAMLMSGYVRNKRSREALRLFYHMHLRGLCANTAAFTVILQACADLAAMDSGKQIHAQVFKRGLISDVYIGNAVVGMYAKAGHMDGARKTFDEMSIRDEVLWNAMITGYSQVGNRDKAFKVFELMKWEDVNQDYFSYVGVLSACAGAAALIQGACIHACAVLSGLESDVSIGNALVDMYAKCGSIKDSWKVFDTMVVRAVVTWNAMVSGYAQHGCASEALKFFDKMKRVGIKPDHVTYLAILSACSHVGLVDEGLIHFKLMKEDHGVEAMEEHYACIIDILGRAGRLDEAHKFINVMPVKPSGLMWRTLLAACKSHGNVELGAKAAWEILDIERDDSAAHVLLSNIYAMYDRWIDVEIIRNGMRGRGVMKEPGCSWIEIKDGLEVFLVGGKRSGDAPQNFIKPKNRLHLLLLLIPEIGDSDSWLFHLEIQEILARLIACS